MREVTITAETLDAIMTHASEAMPKECCGLLLSAENQINQIQPAANVHPTPETHFEIEPIALISAHRAQRAGGPCILGFYHSHPSGPPTPSATDRAMAAHDGKIWAIIGQDEIKFWRDDPDGFKPLSYSVIDA